MTIRVAGFQFARWLSAGGRWLKALFRLLLRVGSCPRGAPSECVSEPPRQDRPIRLPSRSQRFKAWFLGNPAEPIVPPPRPARARGKVGICCSGGGIRSAAYNLGALQALQERGVYQRAHYISAVSGGAYIATALATLKSKDGSISGQVFGRGSPAEHYLRNHSTYLAAARAERLRLVWRLVGGLLVNVVLITAVLAAVGLPVGWWVSQGIRDKGVPGDSLIDPVPAQDGSTIGVLTAPDGTTLQRQGNFGGFEPVKPSTKVYVEPELLYLVTGDDVLLEPTAERLEVPKGESVTVLPTQTFKIRETDLRATAEEKGGRPEALERGTTVKVPDDTKIKFENANVDLIVGADSVVEARGEIVADVCHAGRPCVDHGGSERLNRWLLGALFVTLFVALLRFVFNVFPDAWMTFMAAWTRRAMAVIGAVALAFIVLPELVEYVRNFSPSEVQRVVAAGLAGGGSVIAALALELVGLRPKTAAPIDEAGKIAEGVKSVASRVGPRLRGAVVSFVGAVVGPLLLAATFLSFVVVGSREGATRWLVFWLVVACVVATVILVVGDVTLSSMHSFYKERLASAFLLEPDRDGDVVKPVKDVDSVRLSELPCRPQLIICAAVNLIDPGVTPPGRAAASFTFSREGIGSGPLGTLDAQAYETGERFDHFKGDVSVAAAMAISGAAVSPAMGKETRRRYTFLLALANVRLGVWLPNPLRRDSKIPLKVRPHYLAREALLLMRASSKFVYVTDGGHYDNLGLVELLRRGCTTIYCFDASGGAVNSYDTLGKAIALASSELDVSITIDPQKDMTPPKDAPEAGNDHSIGTIHYADGTTGKLIFVRTRVVSGDRWDVRAYARRDPAFPTTATSDQLYTDEKFEAYRALGYDAAGRALVSTARDARRFDGVERASGV